MFSYIFENKSSVNPSKFAKGKQETARLARNADEDHTRRISGTSILEEKKNSFLDSIDSWNPQKNRSKVKHDGGMHELARRRGLR